MINNKDFIKRLQLILDHYSLSASAFADSINVQRSNISHLLSGRNNPSLDFVLKVTETYEDVKLDWLLNGIGEFPKTNDLFTDVNKEKKNLYDKNEIKLPHLKKDISKIVFFYKDGTFDIFEKN